MPVAVDTQRLRHERERSGHTQKTFAEAAGIARSYYCEIESGRTHAGPRVLRRIATTLGVEPRELTLPYTEAQA